MSAQVVGWPPSLPHPRPDHDRTSPGRRQNRRADRLRPRLGGLPNRGAANFRSHRQQVHVNPLLTTAFVLLNVNAAPFNDTRIRQALNPRPPTAATSLTLTADQPHDPPCQILPPDTCSAGAWRRWSGNPRTARRLTGASSPRHGCRRPHLGVGGGLRGAGLGVRLSLSSRFPLVAVESSPAAALSGRARRSAAGARAPLRAAAAAPRCSQALPPERGA